MFFLLLTSQTVWRESAGWKSRDLGLCSGSTATSDFGPMHWVWFLTCQMQELNRVSSKTLVSGDLCLCDLCCPRDVPSVNLGINYELAPFLFPVNFLNRKGPWYHFPPKQGGGGGGLRTAGLRHGHWQKCPWVYCSVTQILAVGCNNYFHENKKFHPHLLHNTMTSLTVHLKKVYGTRNILTENPFRVVLLKRMQNCRLIWWKPNHELPTSFRTCSFKQANHSGLPKEETIQSSKFRNQLWADVILIIFLKMLTVQWKSAYFNLMFHRLL